MPGDSLLKVTYEVYTDSTLSGEFLLKGEFSYILNNDRFTFDIPERKIRIIDKSTGTLAKANNIKTIDKVDENVEKIQNEKKEISAIREIIEMNGGKEFFVRIRVFKYNVSSAGLIVETIPEGFVAFNESNGDGKFSFKNLKVEFQWMKLPIANSLDVSYKLIPKNTENIAKPYIAGDFTCFVDNKKKTTVIRNEILPVEKEEKTIVAEKQIQKRQIIKKQIQKKQKSTYELENEKPVSIFKAIATLSQAGKKIREKIHLKKSKIKSNTNKKSNSKTTPKTKTKSVKKKQMKNLSYRIQIFESKELVTTDFFKKYRIDGVVLAEKIGKKYTYTVGNFKSKKDAEKFRIEIMQKTLISMAKIITYDHGERISK
jgi:hypothetical protein